MNSSGQPWYHLALWYLQPHLPCCGHMSMHQLRMKVLVAYVPNLGDSKANGSLALASYGPPKLLVASHDANKLLTFMQCTSTTQIVRAIRHAMGNASGRIMSTISPTVYCCWIMQPIAYNWHAWQNVKNLQGFLMNLTPKHIRRMSHDFYPSSTPKACGERSFLVPNCRRSCRWYKEFVKGPHTQGYIYDSMVIARVDCLWT